MSRSPLSFFFSRLRAIARVSSVATLVFCSATSIFCVACGIACDSSVRITALGRLGSASRIARRTASGARVVNPYGILPVSNLYSSTPSEYTSVDVVIVSPRTCSGLA